MAADRPGQFRAEQGSAAALQEGTDSAAPGGTVLRAGPAPKRVDWNYGRGFASSGIVRPLRSLRQANATSDATAGPNEAAFIQGECAGGAAQTAWDLAIAHPPAGTSACDVGVITECRLDFFVEVQSECPALPYKCVRRGEPDCIVRSNFGGYRVPCWWHSRVGRWPVMDMDAPSHVQTSRQLGRRPQSERRSRFWPGMAAAMAKQWGCFLPA